MRTYSELSTQARCAAAGGLHPDPPPPRRYRYWHGVRIASERVSRLHLAGNCVSGCLNELASLTELMYLNLAGNEIQGTLEPLAGLKHLKHVDLRVNQLQVDTHACACARTNARPRTQPSGQLITAREYPDLQGALPLELIRMKCRNGGSLLLHSNPGFTLPVNFSTLCDEGGSLTWHFEHLDLSDCSLVGGCSLEAFQMLASIGSFSFKGMSLVSPLQPRQRQCQRQRQSPHSAYTLDESDPILPTVTTHDR